MPPHPVTYSDIGLSPQGGLFVHIVTSEDVWPDPSAAERLSKSLNGTSASALLALATHELETLLPPAASWWRHFGKEYLSQICHLPNLDQTKEIPPFPPPHPSHLEGLVEGAPPMHGGEYLSSALLASLWSELDTLVRSSIGSHNGSAASWLHDSNPSWRTVGRVVFHLAENKNNPALPFAFMASYGSRLSSSGKVQHLPLGRALQEFAGGQNNTALLNLLAPVQKAAESSLNIRALVESGRIYQPLPWTARDTYLFLKDIPLLETAGIIVRLPDWWKGKPPTRPTVKVTIGNDRFTRMGADSLLDFSVAAVLDGEVLSPDELKAILSTTEGLVFIRGRWTEVNAAQLKSALDHWKAVEMTNREEGLSFLEGMRLLSGFSDTKSRSKREGISPQEPSHEWTGIEAGEWLKSILDRLRDPSQIKTIDEIPGLNANLRPYQKVGVQWLQFITGIGLGGCLADDMGLGKTVQILATLLLRKATNLAKPRHKPCLLVAPASLLGNWKAEITRFAPSLRSIIVHPSEAPLDTFTANGSEALNNVDFVLTTYGVVSRAAALRARPWDLVILDEAQAIKNGATRQSKAVKELQASSRLALTGTPVENRASDLWSLFDFINPGLLGTASEFENYVKRCNAATQPDYAGLRKLTKPYILRRLKTDKRVISDLPEKTELTAWCSLSPVQAALYSKSVKELADSINSTEGIQRKGLILAFLLRFKQICNHPSQWNKDELFAPEASGKFTRLRALAEEIAERQEKVLVFTQFREMATPLSDFLSSIFSRPGLILHGGTPIPQRRKMVDTFQHDAGPPFFILTVKAGGAGLNLTQAAHVLHFDRWWNPAVENQATDRAFRIGQKKNVLVHKFICRGTVEEKIDRLIEEKKLLSEELIGGGGGESLLSEMSNEELMHFVSLDLERATAT